MTELHIAVKKRLECLPKGLRQHIERSRHVAKELAHIHQIDITQSDLGTAAHDLARALTGTTLLEEARRFGLLVQPVERLEPLLLHGPVAAMWLEYEDGITETPVLDAIRSHTTGRNGMGPVAKVVFLADKLDPKKIELYPNLDKVKKLADFSLDHAMLEFLNQNLAYLLRQSLPIHPASIELQSTLKMELDVFNR